MQLEKLPEIRLILDDQHLEVCRRARAAPPTPVRRCSSSSIETVRMRRWPPGVFQARSRPASDQSCTVRSETPSRSAASRVEQTSCTGIHQSATP